MLLTDLHEFFAIEALQAEAQLLFAEQDALRGGGALPLRGVPAATG